MMRHTYLTTRWTPEEAHSIIQCLDMLRESLMQTYGSEIAQWLQQQQQATPMTESRDEPPF